MDSNYFDSALNSLSKTQHKRRLLQILFVVRKGTTGQQQIANVEKIQKKKTLKYLIGCLNSDSSNVIDITLSILGNVFCISPSCCRDAVYKYDVLPHLSDVLDKHEEDSIRGRTFRIIGNLNKHDVCLSMMKLETNLIRRVTVFLKSVSLTKHDCKASEATIAMAIRSLRKLISSDTLLMFITEFEALQVIGQLLVKYTNTWTEDKASKAIVDDLVRLLLVLTKYKHAESFRRLKQVDLADALSCFSTLVTTYPARIIKIIFNFSISTLSKTNFPIKEIAENLIIQIQSVDLTKVVKNEELFKEQLKAICNLMEYPVYRADTKEAGGLELLINLLENMTALTSFNLECCQLILSTLGACKYDETTITRDNCARIINLLTLKLKWIITDTNTINTQHSFKSKSKDTMISLRRKCFDMIRDDSKRAKSDFLEAETFMISEDSSPERSVSPCSSSDISSNPNSPNYTLNLDDEELSDSDNYSPICSDNEESEPLPSQTEDCALSDQEDPLKPRDEIPFSNYLYKKYLEDKVRVLLNWYVEMKPPVMEMVNKQLIVSLLNVTFSTTYFNSKTFNVILKILRVAEFLLPILLMDLIPKIHDLKYYVHDSNCAKCLEQHEKSATILMYISSLAESPVGRGEIEYQFHKADAATKQKLILVLPYVMRSRSVLNKMLLKSDGLTVLIRLLDAKLNLQNTSLKSLLVLAMQLKMRYSISNLKLMKPLSKHEYDSTDLDDLVTFKLDDGSTVMEKRNFLINRSEYFRILLSGDFKESKETEIILHDVSSKSLQYLFTLLRQEIPENGHYLDLNLDLETVLDLIGLAEQYVMLELSAYLANYVQQFYTTSEDLPIIYKWSVVSGTNILRLKTILYALVGSNFANSERLQIFGNIFNSGLTQYCADDIKTLLIGFLA